MMRQLALPVEAEHAAAVGVVADILRAAVDLAGVAQAVATTAAGITLVQS